MAGYPVPYPVRISDRVGATGGVAERGPTRRMTGCGIRAVMPCA